MRIQDRSTGRREYAQTILSGQLSTIFSVVLFSFLLIACTSSEKSGSREIDQSRLDKQFDPVPQLFIGQLYPQQEIALQAVVDTPQSYTSWPKQVSYFSLYSLANQESFTTGTAEYIETRSDIYVPSYEQMPNSRSSQCDSVSITLKENVQYAITDTDEDRIQDVFSRGMPDNCFRDDNIGMYRINVTTSESIPLIAIAGSQQWSVSYEDAGNIRPLTEEEKMQIDVYRTKFRTEFEQAYDTKFDPDTSNIGDIPTLASAKILLEVMSLDRRYRVRVSQWEKISVAYHIYQVYEFSIFQGNQLIRSVDVVRSIGVLG